MQTMREAQGIHSPVWHVPPLFPRTSAPRALARRDQGKLVERSKVTTDKVADMLTRIRNAYMANKSDTTMEHTILREGVLRVMEKSGYIQGYEGYTEGKKKKLRIRLRYLKGKPVLTTIKRISKPGRRVYKSFNKLTPVLSGLGIAILSTPRGIMTNQEARKQHVGGEVLCELW